MSLSEELNDYIKLRQHRLINSVLLYHDGEMLVERYYNGFDNNSKNVMRSIAKSITSIAAGICLDRGLIGSVKDPIYKYLPIFGEGREIYHRGITVQSLLTMSSGIYWNGGVHYHCPQLYQLRKSKDWLEYIADIAVKYPPYTKYVYKEPDVMLLGEVIAKASGMPLYDFIEKNLYEPLGIQSGRWYQAPCGMTYSVANGEDDEYEAQSNLSARDLLKIGKLYLQDGFYDGKQILSREYISECITPSKCEKGYGYMWWLGENWYGCRGYGGQNMTVFPKEKVIFVMQATQTPRGMAYYDVFGWVCEKVKEISS